MSVKIESGRRAKTEGHEFEHVLSNMFNKKFGKKFVVEGASNTKIDVRDTDSIWRLSVKNPSGKNTQIGLYTQNSFINAMNITDTDILDFIEKFFGGNSYDNFPRHRMTKSEIEPNLNQKFLNFLNTNKEKLLDLLCTHGHNQIGDVNYLIWAKEKNNPNSIIMIDLKEFKDALMQGEWKQNETTFEYLVNDSKMFHLQMKGSGTKYTNGYHSLMFHIHSNFKESYIKDISILNA